MKSPFALHRRPRPLPASVPSGANRAWHVRRSRLHPSGLGLSLVATARFNCSHASILPIPCADAREGKSPETPVPHSLYPPLAIPVQAVRSFSGSLYSSRFQRRVKIFSSMCIPVASVFLFVLEPPWMFLCGFLPGSMGGSCLCAKSLCSRFVKISHFLCCSSFLEGGKGAQCFPLNQSFFARAV